MTGHMEFDPKAYLPRDLIVQAAEEMRQAAKTLRQQAADFDAHAAKRRTEAETVDAQAEEYERVAALLAVGPIK